MVHDLDKLKAWLDAGHEVNYYVPQCSLGHPPTQTPLTAICSNSKAANVLEIVKFLVERGADVNQRRLDKYEETPLLAACESQEIDVVQYLLEQGADVNVRDNQGRGVLGRARCEVAAFVEDWIAKRTTQRLRVLCLRQVIDSLSSLDQVDSLAVPEELKEEIRSVFWKHRQIVNIHETIQAWIRLLPLEKEHLRQVLISMIEATADNKQCYSKEGFKSKYTTEIYLPRLKIEGGEENIVSKSEEFRYIKSEYVRSAILIVHPKSWTLHLPMHTSFHFVYMETSYYNFVASYKVDGWYSLLTFLKSLDLSKEDAYPFLVFLYGYAIDRPIRITRKDLLFPEILRGNIPVIPAYFTQLAKKWCREK